MASSILSGSCVQLASWIASFERLHVDLGTGDGCYALHVAKMHPDMAVLGIDTCLDNLTKAARRDLPNLRFIACDATRVPDEMHGKATGITVNFPYGSLFHALTGDDPELQTRIFSVAAPDARIELWVNASAAQQYGVQLSTLEQRLRSLMRRLDASSATVEIVPQDRLRTFPSAWAKRLAYGKPSEVIIASARIGTSP